MQPDGKGRSNQSNIRRKPTTAHIQVAECLEKSEKRRWSTSVTWWLMLDRWTRSGAWQL